MVRDGMFALLAVTFLVTKQLTGIHILEITTFQETLFAFTFSSILWTGPTLTYAWSILIIASCALLIKKASRP